MRDSSSYCGHLPGTVAFKRRTLMRFDFSSAE
jgi:hypothetical protein